MDFLSQARLARERIGPFVRRTPLESAPQLGDHVYLKLENQQLTGSFKVRGALNRLLSLTESEKRAGIAAASSGNHGLGVAEGLARFGIEGTVFVPRNAAPAKVEAIRRRGAKVVVSGETCELAEKHAREIAGAQGRVFISPYNDPKVIAGQGTIGLELAEQAAELGIRWDAIFLAVGCGGLAAGVAGTLKALHPGVRVFGCSPSADCAMANSVAAGHIVDKPAKPTLSDGTAGGVEPGSITFEFCRELVDEFVLVEEEEIVESWRWLLAYPHQMVEGAAAVALAGFRRKQETLSGKNVAIILCGANAGIERLRQILE